MNYARQINRLASYQRKLQKMTPGQQRSRYAQWIRHRIRKITRRLQAIDAAVGVHHRPVGNYSIETHEL